MAEDSAVHDGITTGDAVSTDVWSAPYDSAEYSDIYSKLLAGNAAAGFVVPDYANNLKITANSPAAMNVIVKSGAAFLRGRIYENTADNTLTIDAADPANPRIDRIILRYVAATQTIRLIVLKGTAAGTPALPALTQTAATYEIEIAYVWVAAAAASIADTEVYDTRQFMPTADSLAKCLLQQNLIKNSEFMAWSSNAGAIGTAPAYWMEVAGTRNYASATKASQMIRGRAVQITATSAAPGIKQIFQVKPSTTYTIKHVMNVTAGDVGRIAVSTNSASPATITRNVRRTGAFIEQLIYYTTESDATEMNVQLIAVNNTDVVQFGQTIVVEGYHPGPFRAFSETLMFNNDPLADASWTATAKSTSSVGVNLTSNFGSMILTGTRAVWVQIEANDSGSAAGTGIFLAVTATGAAHSAYSVKLILDGQANDKIMSDCGLVSTHDGTTFTTAPIIAIALVASGALTLDATVRIMGIVT